MCMIRECLQTALYCGKVAILLLTYPPPVPWMVDVSLFPNLPA
jgi:hypothetical protein